MGIGAGAGRGGWQAAGSGRREGETCRCPGNVGNVSKKLQTFQSKEHALIGFVAKRDVGWAKKEGVWAKNASCGQKAHFCGQRKIHILCTKCKSVVRLVTDLQKNGFKI